MSANSVSSSCSTQFQQGISAENIVENVAKKQAAPRESVDLNFTN
jgi:hypothetical protein